MGREGHYTFFNDTREVKYSITDDGVKFIEAELKNCLNKKHTEEIKIADQSTQYDNKQDIEGFE